MQNTELKSSSSINLNPDVAWRILGKYLIAITPKDSKVHRFNETGTLIWNNLDEEPKSLETLRDLMVSNFDVDKKTAQKDLMKFIAEIYNKGLITIDS